MSGELWAAVAVPALMLLGFWLDYRHRTSVQHRENSDRLTRIEVKLDPIWDWWNERRKEKGT